jgi:hypothetical protein
MTQRAQAGADQRVSSYGDTLMKVMIDKSLNGSSLVKHLRVGCIMGTLTSLNLSGAPVHLHAHSLTLRRGASHHPGHKIFSMRAMGGPQAAPMWRTTHSGAMRRC